MTHRTLLIRQAPKRFIIVEQDTETLECIVYPHREAREQGVAGYTYNSIKNAVLEGWAHRYRTIKEALSEHPEAQRSPGYDLGSEITEMDDENE